jgi:hypothetical protein
MLPTSIYEDPVVLQLTSGSIIFVFVAGCGTFNEMFLVLFLLCLLIVVLTILSTPDLTNG